MANAECAYTPRWSDHSEWLEHEAAVWKVRVRYRQSPGSELPAAPQKDVEVEHSWPPALASPAAEIALQRLETGEHCKRSKATLDQSHGICKIPSRTPVRSVKDDRRSVEQTEHLVQARNGRLDHRRRTAVTSVRTV